MDKMFDSNCSITHIKNVYKKRKYSKKLKISKKAGLQYRKKPKSTKKAGRKYQKKAKINEKGRKYQKRPTNWKRPKNVKQGRISPSVVAFLNGRFFLPQSFDRLEHSRRFELFDRPAVDAANEFGHFCRSFFVFELKFEQIHRLDQRLHRQDDISNDPPNNFLMMK